MKKKIYKNSLEEEELHGPVKQLKETTYEVVSRSGSYVPGLLSDMSFQNSLSNFNREGMITDKYNFTVEGLEQHIHYTPTGKVSTIIEYEKDGSIESDHRFSYNEADEIIRTYNDHPNKNTQKLWITEDTRNEHGLVTESITTVDGQLHSRTTYVHDDAGNTIDQLMYDKDNKLERKIERTFNAGGRQETQKNYNGQLELTEHTIMHYGPGGEYLGITKNGVYQAYEEPLRRSNEYEYDHHQNWVKEICYEYADDNNKPEDFKFRQITYYDEPSENVELTIDDNVYDMAAVSHPIPSTAITNLSPGQWQWIAEGGKDRQPFSVFRYYTALHGFFPSRTTIASWEVDLWSLKRYLIRSFGAAEIFRHSIQEGNCYDEQHQQYVLAFSRNKYIFEANDIQHINSYYYQFAKKPADAWAEIADHVQFGNIHLYYPAGNFGVPDEDFEEELKDIIASFRVEKEAEKPQISMVTTLGASFSLKTYPVKDDFIIKDLDLNYGSGFEKFNNELMEKFRSSSQGLILFHGAPGTGKTFYVRHLLRKMSESKKVVIYMPPNMVDHLVEPSFITFISSQVSAFTAGGKSCIMLIEDAEPLLVSRDANIRIQGITNLLNMTDGLLNDLLGMQIICTFNVPLKQLDEALLRPGRLIARKEFKALPEFEANVLAHSLGIKHVFTGPATLSEIYAKGKDKKMLTHDE